MTQARSKVVQETENPFGDDEEEEAAREAEERRKAQAAAGPSTQAQPLQFGRSPGMVDMSSSKDKKKKKDKDKKSGKGKKFNLEAEKEQMKSVIAEASMASTNLVNALQSINREKERISDNQAVIRNFEACKQLRRRVLRYVSLSRLYNWHRLTNRSFLL